MIVVADTTPINYLVILGQQEVLPKLYGKVIIPQAVYDELINPLAPKPVSVWINTQPEWLEVQQPAALLKLLDLGKGEHEAISLAKELNATVVLMDDLKGRNAARAQGLNITGTLGILILAWQSGFLDLRQTLDQLLETNFRISNNELEKLNRRLEAHDQETKKQQNSDAD